MSHIVTSIPELEALYGEVNEASLVKETDRIVPEYRAFVEAACGRPLVWLIENETIVEVAEAVAAGVSGAFYWDQIGPELLSVIDRLIPGKSSNPAPLPTGAHLRRAGSRRRDPVSAEGRFLSGLN